MINGTLRNNSIDRIIIVPTGVPVLKKTRDLTLAGYRYYMAKKAVEGIRSCDVSAVEIVSEQTSYTIDTLRTVLSNKSFGTKDHLFLICGSDVLFEFEKWYKPDEILRMATLMIAERPGYDERKVEEKASEIEKKFSGKVELFPIDPVDVSSRFIRETRDFSQIPDPVKEFISSNDLYPSDRPLASLSDRAFDQVCEIGRILFSELSERRFLHSLNTAVLAVRYALRFGEDPDMAAIAGLLHDCAKELPLQRQIELAEGVCKTDTPVVEMLHAPAGAKYAQTRYHITDCELLNAICYHTTGRGGMTGMEKIIYLADKLEPARKFDDLSEIRKLVETDLDTAMIECLRSVRKALKLKGMHFHKDSSDALAELERQK